MWGRRTVYHTRHHNKNAHGKIKGSHKNQKQKKTTTYQKRKNDKKLEKKCDASTSSWPSWVSILFCITIVLIESC